MSYQNKFYLTGSINQPTVADAFRFVGSRLQPAVTRVPTGNRASGPIGCSPRPRISWTIRRWTSSR